MIENEKKKEKKKLFYTQTIIISFLAILLLIGLILIPVSSFIRGQEGIIRIREKGYVKFNSFMSIGSVILADKSKTFYQQKKKALNHSVDDYSLSLISLNNVTDVHFIKKKKNENLAKEGAIPTIYLGIYKINAEGNIGYIYIKQKNGYIYGSIRFPNYAKGVYEKMKYLKINNRYISFIRSAQTSAEVRYIGASKKFIQKYSGVYTRNGRIISGTYKIPGSIRNWKAYKIK